MKSTLGLLLLAGVAACDGDPPETLPAPVLPQVISYGGSVMTGPIVVPVFFAGEDSRATIEDFLGQLAASDYWRATTAEYGVGALTIDPSLVLNEPPPLDAEPYLLDRLDGLYPAWPANDAQKIFLLFLLAQPNDGFTHDPCDDDSGYHSEIPIARGPSIVYAVIRRCPTLAPYSVLDGVTETIAHELIEASTDPLVRTKPAFGSADGDHYAWSLATGGELADMCTFEPQSYQRLVGPYLVPRSWSNQTARDGHDPCVPASGAPYFIAAPIANDVVTYDYGTGTYAFEGISVPLNHQRTIQVQLFSDRATGSWTVDAAPVDRNSSALHFKWDKTVGRSGDILHLTITRVLEGTIGGDAVVFTSSQSGAVANTWYAFIGN